jgi:NADH-quinone oxidoreductase subunit G
MEFLLINHPLDCPICDQGGECELQDLAMGYGRSVSRFVERKRVVKDENLGPLVATDMTRCIHCTRCVRFLDEVAGTTELGGMYRGEHMEISTWVGKGVHSELSGNIIDLCPVGALTSKPYRFRARAWEMLSHPTVSPHDCVGSNIHVHQVRGVIKRVVPRQNEAINETWIADRDRFGYQGVQAPDRLQKPLARIDGEWRELDWEAALEHTASGLRALLSKHGGDGLGALMSPSATVEEMYLLSKLMRGLGSDHVDHRLRQADFRDDAVAPAWPSLGMDLDEVGRLEAVLFIGGYPRHDQPMLGHRLRQAAKAGGQIQYLNPRRFDWNYLPAAEHVVPAASLVSELACVVAAAADQRKAERPAGLDDYLAGSTPGAAHGELARRLIEGARSAVFLGNLVETHPAGAELRLLAARLAEITDSRYGLVGHGANSAGGWMAGALPHRRFGGTAGKGLNARAMLEQPRRGYVLLGMEPELDCWDGATARAALAAADFNVVLSPWVTDAMRDYASVILPVGTFGETAGTYVNTAGRWQPFAGVGRPVGEARPAWRLLRVLGNLLDLDGFDYEAPDEIHGEIRGVLGDGERPAPPAWSTKAVPASRVEAGLLRLGAASLYGVDPLVRRAPALQETQQAQSEGLALAPETAAELGVGAGDWVRVRQAGAEARLAVQVDARVPAGTVWFAGGIPGSAGLGPLVGSIEIERA